MPMLRMPALEGDYTEEKKLGMYPLAVRYAATRDPAVLDRLVHSSEVFVRHAVQRYGRGIGVCDGIDWADLLQEGRRGLVRAARKFRPDCGHRFSTYATWWIRSHVVRALENHGHTVRIKSAGTEKWLYRAAARFARQHGRPPTDPELMAATGLPASQLALAAQGRMVRDACNARYEPWDCDRTTDAGEAPDARAAESERDAAVDAAFRWLDPRSREVVRRRYGFGRDPETLEEIGRGLGITRERVRQIEARALRKLEPHLLPLAAI
jgi:RNA polymerase primary sigma factor